MAAGVDSMYSVIQSKMRTRQDKYLENVQDVIHESTGSLALEGLSTRHHHCKTAGREGEGQRGTEGRALPRNVLLPFSLSIPRRFGVQCEVVCESELQIII